VNLQPSIAILPSGEVYVAWEAGANGRFEIRGRSWKDGSWAQPETLSRGGTQEFRPALAAATNGTLWVAWDRANGSRYETLAKYRNEKGWSGETPVFSPEKETRDPQIAADPFGRVWVLAEGKLAGLASSGERYELSAKLPEWSPDFLTIDAKGRFWLFKVSGERSSFDWQKSWKNAGMAWAVVDSQGVHLLPEQETAMGYAAPHVDPDGNVWVMNNIQFLRFAAPFPGAAGAALTKPARLEAAAPAPPAARAWPRYEVALNGNSYRVYWAEMHNHLKEQPGDRIVRSWIDRLYLSARYSAGLDVVALTDHDWPEVTRSMYYVEQSIANVLNAPGQFLAFSGFEWSGDSQTRARFGDRTVLFPDGYHDIPRIGDEAANDAAKLSVQVRAIGGLDWPHHIGRAESPVHPKYLNPATEPVVEMTSGHGVFETYNPRDAVPVPYKTQIIPGTSMQDILASGKRVGMVGSSDSHSGFSGYRVGMFAVIAPELTRTAILNAIRARRTYAIRGGRPILVDLRADGHFIGEEFTSGKAPRLVLSAQSESPITRIDIVRNNRHVLSRAFSDGALRRTLEYQDTEAPPAFYYARIFQEDGYAWTSPIWVDPAKRAAWRLPLLLALITAPLVVFKAAGLRRSKRRRDRCRRHPGTRREVAL
jgi:hypothetical protein